MNVTAKLAASLMAALCLAGCGKAKTSADSGGVFGVHMGDTVASLADVRPLREPPLFNFTFRPREGDPAFGQYAVLAGPGAGACAVRARGTGMTLDALNALVDRLKGRYGPGAYNAGVRSYYWFPTSTDPATSNFIQSVVLSNFGTDVSLTYTFKNIATCNQELAVQDDSGP